MNRCAIGDCRAVLRSLDAGIFNACVTSPPYWGLRDYGTGTWDGGDPSCDHKRRRRASPRSFQRLRLGGGKGAPHQQEGFAAECSRCGARRIDSQIGVEETPDRYVENLVAVFAEVRRVLRDDGVLWLNLGDSYARNGGTQGGGDRKLLHMEGVQKRMLKIPAGSGLKQKDLVGIPWRVAFALQADGWYLRSDVVWHKPNPMPESVTDRPTRAHEFVFLLSKSEKYFYDAAAIAEPAIGADRVRADVIGGNKGDAIHHSPGGVFGNKDSSERAETCAMTRNARDVWSIASEPFSGAHFAVMPSALVSRCILSGSPAGGLVLDPFIGSGTVAEVAQALGRRWFGCELNPEYARLIAKRTAQQGLL